MGDTTIASDIKSAIQDVADDIGKQITVRRITKGALVNATKPSLGYSETVSNHNGDCIVFDYESELIDGTIIKEGDRGIVISLDDFSIIPTTKDFIIDGTEQWKIVDVNLTEIAGVDCVCTLQTRL